MGLLNALQGKIVENIAEILIHHGETVCVAESSSGGLVSAALLSYPGASRYFVGGCVLYSYPIREAILGMGENEHKKYGGSTPELILDLASELRKKTLTTWCIGEGGAAGPSSSPYGHPAGYTAFAIDGPVRSSKIMETGSENRAENMSIFATSLLDFFLSELQTFHRH